MTELEYTITGKQINDLYAILIQNGLQHTANEMFKTFRSCPLSEHDQQEHADFIADRIRCDKTDCMDYHKELCSPWKCSYYLRKHDKKIQQDEREKVLKPFEEFTASLRDIESSYIKYMLNQIAQTLRQDAEETS